MMKIGIASGDRIPSAKATDGKPHWGGAGWVRLGQYQEPLKVHHNIEVVVGTLVWNRDHFSIDISEGKQVFVDVDIIYLQRLMHAGLGDRIAQARAEGQIIINDLDDWYWGLAPSNNAWASSHPKTNPRENINHYKAVLNQSTCVTVSTPYLADRLKAFVHCPIHVLANTVDVARFQVVEHTNDCPTVGWVGSTGHRSGDLEILKGILRPMVDSGEIKFLHSGYNPAGKHISELVGIPEDSVQTKQATDPEDYHTLLTMEVGLAPLNDVPFNHAKSDIKLLEYSSAGIPWIGSALPSYTGLQQQLGLGRVAKKPTQWIKHLKDLRDPNVRATEGSALREAVWQRDISVGAKTLAEFLRHQSS